MSVIDWEKIKENPEYEISKLCSINTADLEEALEKHAAIYAYYHAMYERARADEGQAEWKYEQEKGKAFSDLRDEGEAIGSATEKAELAPAVVEAREEYMKRERKRRILWSLVQGLESRQQMIVQLSARQRAEMQNTY